MGTTYAHKPKGMTSRKFFEHEFRDEAGNTRVVDMAVVNRVAYIAYRNDDNVILALVMPLHYAPKDHCNFGFKDQDETMGPYHYDCPERILNLLTEPALNEYAAEWRAKCREYIAQKKARPKLKVGMYVHFASPLVFPSGTQRAQLQVVSLKPLLYRDFYGNIYRVPRSYLDGAKFEEGVLEG